jgi:hypothetical protein
MVVSLDERCEFPKKKRSDSGEGDCAAGDENSVLFDECSARLPFVDKRLALFVLLQCWVEVSLCHVGSGKRKSPADARLGVGTKKAALRRLIEFGA